MSRILDALAAFNARAHEVLHPTVRLLIEAGSAAGAGAFAAYRTNPNAKGEEIAAAAGSAAAVYVLGRIAPKLGLTRSAP